MRQLLAVIIRSDERRMETLPASERNRTCRIKAKDLIAYPHTIITPCGNRWTGYDRGPPCRRWSFEGTAMVSLEFDRRGVALGVVGR